MQSDIAAGWSTVIKALGYDANNAHLKDTPMRVARFMSEWHTEGQAPPTMTVFPDGKYDEMIVVGGISFYSMCAHHGLPFFGTAAIGYIPNGRIVGLSKLARVVDYYARRFQVQEKLTGQVAQFLEDKIQPLGVGVVLRAEHLCMSMRGIQRPGHHTVTSDMRGVMRSKPEARAEFLAMLK